MKNYISEPVETIYFGGGTPSILNKQQLSKIIDSLYKNYDINPSLEFTLEANPDDLIDNKLQFYTTLGINRLSIGTQSFADDVLLFLNRSHTAKQTKQAIELSKKWHS
jgi:oxygen-independent coproporphyrinogen-3 oxidase